MTHIEKARYLRKIIEQAMFSVDDKSSSEAIELLPVLKNNGVLIKAGTRINYNGIIKKVSVDIYDITENNPDNAPTLWEDIEYKDGYRIIPEVFNVTNAFTKDEIGWWGDLLYQSLVDNNVYTPEQYAPNWMRIEKE